MDYRTLCHMQAWIVRQHAHETDSALSALHGLMLAEAMRDPERYQNGASWWQCYDACVEHDPDWRDQ